MDPHESVEDTGEHLEPIASSALGVSSDMLSEPNGSADSPVAGPSEKAAVEPGAELTASFAGIKDPEAIIPSLGTFNAPSSATTDVSDPGIPKALDPVPSPIEQRREALPAFENVPNAFPISEPLEPTMSAPVEALESLRAFAEESAKKSPAASEVAPPVQPPPASRSLDDLLKDEETPESGESQKNPAHSGEPYAESMSAFEEIRHFGEQLKSSPDSAPPHRLSGHDKATVPSAEPRVALKSESTQERLMTTGDSLPGYQIESYLQPVSVTHPFDPSQEKPLSAAFEKLWAQAKSQEGNGIIAIRWSLFSGDTKVLVTGTVVRCARLK